MGSEAASSFVAGSVSGMCVGVWVWEFRKWATLPIKEVGLTLPFPGLSRWGVSEDGAERRSESKILFERPQGASLDFWLRSEAQSPG